MRRILFCSHCLMSCRMRLSSILDLPEPVEPQTYRCVERISGVITRGVARPGPEPSFNVFPGMRRIARRQYLKKYCVSKEFGADAIDNDAPLPHFWCDGTETTKLSL